MRTATWFRVDLEVGKNVRFDEIVSALILSLVVASLLGIVITFVAALLFKRPGIVTIIGALDLVALSASAIPYFLVGYIIARVGLNVGVFGYWVCLAVSVLLMGCIWLLTALFLLHPATSDVLRDVVLCSVRFGLLYGIPAATIFWRRIVRSYPELCRPNFGPLLNATVRCFS